MKIKAPLYYIFPSLIELIIIFFLAFQLKYPVEDGYLLWQHIVLGQLDIAGGHIVSENPFTYLPHRLLKRSSWLSDDIFYLLYRSSGYEGIIVVKIVILLALFYLPFLLFENQVLSYTVFLPLYILLILPGTALRPNLFALIAFLFVVFGFYKKDMKIMSIVTFLWSFLHGSYVLGILLILLYLLFNFKSIWNAKEKHIIFLVMALIPLFLPHSSYFLYKKLATQGYILRGMEEWLPLKIRSFIGGVTVLYTAILICALFKNKRLYLISGSLIFLVLSLLFRRFLPFYAIFTFPILVSLPLFKEGKFSRYSKESSLRPFYLLLFVVYLFLHPPGFHSYFVKENHPYGCEDLLGQLPQNSKILTRQSWVPYLYFVSHGNYKFAVDGTLSETDSIIKAYFDFVACRKKCEELLELLNPDYIIFPADSADKTSKYCEGCLKIEHISPVCVIWKNLCKSP